MARLDARGAGAPRLGVLFRGQTGNLRLTKVLAIVSLCTLCGLLASILLAIASKVWIHIKEDELPNGCDLLQANGTERQLAIDLPATGYLGYWEVRMIQICWDFVIGQGGRLLHAWVVIRLLSNALIYFMETSRMPIELYTSLVVSSSSLDTTLSCLKILWPAHKRNWEIKLTAAWALIAMLYAVGFPVLWSACAGYTNPSQTYWRLPDGSAVDSSSTNFTTCITIYGGSSIGLNEPFLATGGPFPKLKTQGGRQYPTAMFQNFSSYLENASCLVQSALNMNGTMIDVEALSQDNGTFPSSYNSTFHPDSWIYVSSSEYSLLLANQIPWNFSTSEHLDPGIVPYDSLIYLNETIQMIQAPLLRPTDNETCSRSLYECYYAQPQKCYNQEILPQDWDGDAFCATESTFVWGFSQFVLMLAFIFEAVWMSTAYIVWLNFNTRSALCRRGLSLNNLHANIALVAGVMQEALGEDAGSCTIEEIDCAMKTLDDASWKLEEHDAPQTAYVSITGVAPKVDQTKAAKRRYIKRILAEKSWEDDPTALLSGHELQDRPASAA